MDDVGPDIWTMLELNVGVFCVCMPAARKFLARRLPVCFGTVKSSNQVDDTPQACIPKASGSGGKASISKLSGITKSVDTWVQRTGEDDEVELVQIEQNGRSTAPSSTASDEKAKPLTCPTNHERTRQR